MVHASRLVNEHINFSLAFSRSARHRANSSCSATVAVPVNGAASVAASVVAVMSLPSLSLVYVAAANNADFDVPANSILKAGATPAALAGGVNGGLGVPLLVVELILTDGRSATLSATATTTGVTGADATTVGAIGNVIAGVDDAVGNENGGGDGERNGDDVNGEAPGDNIKSSIRSRRNEAALALDNCLVNNLVATGDGGATVVSVFFFSSARNMP